VAITLIRKSPHISQELSTLAAFKNIPFMLDQMPEKFQLDTRFWLKDAS
jgi:hypothetical protein